MNGQEKDYIREILETKIANLDKNISGKLTDITDRIICIDKKLSSTIDNTTKNTVSIAYMKWIFGSLWMLILVAGVIAQYLK